MQITLKPKLQHKIKLSPKLQEAIGLLHLSSVELFHVIQTQLEKNPLLDTLEETSPKELEPSDEDSTDDNLLTESEDDWFDYMYREKSFTPPINNYESPAQTSLQDSLRWQVNLLPMTPLDKNIALVIIDLIDFKGYLPCSLMEIEETLTKNKILCTLEEIETVLLRIQRLEPLGVGSRDIHEFLLLQLEQLDRKTPFLPQTKLLVKDYLSLLMKGDLHSLSKKLNLSKENINTIIHLIRSLRFEPYTPSLETSENIIIPDVFVRKTPEGLKVELNMALFPTLCINARYAEWIATSREKKDSRYCKIQLQEAQWFMKSVERRHSSLLKVAQSIISHQKDFLHRGESHMKPLTLTVIAADTKLHESSISRIIQNKYIETPRGIFSLRYFFSNAIPAHEGNEYSTLAIKNFIRKLIQKENVIHPLSDEKIALLLKEEMGISLARRTVTKYREELLIPTSHERKHHKKLEAMRR